MHYPATSGVPGDVILLREISQGEIFASFNPALGAQTAFCKSKTRVVILFGYISGMPPV